jgi:hypothetical protein
MRRPGTLGSVALALVAIGVLACFIAGAALVTSQADPGAEAAGNGADQFSLDMVTVGNTAAGQPVGHTEVLGPRDACWGPPRRA